MTLEQTEIIRRAITKYSNKLRALTSDPSLETTNDFFRYDLDVFAKDLMRVIEILESTSTDNETKVRIAENRDYISLALKWYLNDLRQSIGIAKNRLMNFTPKFRTLEAEIELVDEMVRSPMFRDQ